MAVDEVYFKIIREFAGAFSAVQEVKNVIYSKCTSGIILTCARSTASGHGARERASEVIEAAPGPIMSLWVAGAGYAVCVDFMDESQIMRWSDEQKTVTGFPLYHLINTVDGCV